MKYLLMCIALIGLSTTVIAKEKRKPAQNDNSGNIGRMLVGSTFAKSLVDQELICKSERNAVVMSLSQGQLDQDLVGSTAKVLNLCISRVDAISSPLLSSKDAGKVFEALRTARFACVEDQEVLEALLSDMPLDTGKINTAKKSFEECRTKLTAAISLTVK